jgi:hypothetical protein
MSYTAGPFDIPHLLMQWGGKLPGGETWSCSMRLAQQAIVPGIGPGVPDEGYIDSWLHGSMKDAVSTYHTAPDTHLNPNAKLSFVKLNAIAVDGTYQQDVTHEHVFADLAGGGDPMNTIVNQSSIAVSLTTGFSRGPAHRGRYYLPMPSVQVLADGTVNPAFITPMLASTKTFLEAIADVPGVDIVTSPTPTVMSRKLGAPAHRKITGCAIGKVVDTQRRRRRSLAENYANQALDLGDF